MGSSSDDFQFYKYTPSLVAAAVLSALFLVSSVLHAYQLVRTRIWYLIPLLLGGCCEWIGYVGRAISAHEAPNYTLSPYIVQSILLLIAPVLFAASIYMELGHIILLVDGDHLSVIKKRYLTLIFVCGDIFAFLVQSSGAGMLTKTDPDAKKAGNWIIIGGLALQLIFFGLFVLVALVFHCRLVRTPTPRSVLNDIPWRRHMYILYATSVLIMVRSVFRTVEYIQGSNGYLLRKELWLYIFDAALMLLTMVLLNAVHPSEVNGLLKGRRAIRMLVRVQTLKSVTDTEYPLNEGGKATYPPASADVGYAC